MSRACAAPISTSVIGRYVREANERTTNWITLRCGLFSNLNKFSSKIAAPVGRQPPLRARGCRSAAAGQTTSGKRGVGAVRAKRRLASYAPVSARAHFICFEDLRVDVVNQSDDGRLLSLIQVPTCCPLVRFSHKGASNMLHARRAMRARMEWKVALFHVETHLKMESLLFRERAAALPCAHGPSRTRGQQVG